MKIFIFLLFILCSLKTYPKREIGFIKKVRGRAYLSNQKEKIRLKKDFSIYEDDLLITKKGAVQISFFKGHTVTIAPFSSLHIKRLPEDSSPGLFRLIRGKIKAVVNKKIVSKKYKLKVKTQTASLGIRGTTFTVESDKNTFLYVENGHVEIKSMGKVKNIRNGQVSYTTSQGHLKSNRIFVKFENFFRNSSPPPKKEAKVNHISKLTKNSLNNAKGVKARGDQLIQYYLRKTSTPNEF